MTGSEPPKDKGEDKCEPKSAQETVKVRPRECAQAHRQFGRGRDGNRAWDGEPETGWRWMSQVVESIDNCKDAASLALRGAIALLKSIMMTVLRRQSSLAPEYMRSSATCYSSASDNR